MVRRISVVKLQKAERMRVATFEKQKGLTIHSLLLLVGHWVRSNGVLLSIAFDLISIPVS
jgi:hypothetical protein